MFAYGRCHLFSRVHQSRYLIYLTTVLNFLYCIMLFLVLILSFNVRLLVFSVLVFELLAQYPKLVPQGTFISNSSFCSLPLHLVLFGFHLAASITLSQRILRASQVIIVSQKVFSLFFDHSRHTSTSVTCALTELVKQS